MKHLISLAFLILISTACSPEEGKAKGIVFNKSGIEVIRQNAPPLRLEVEMADTEEKRMHGLMYRAEMPLDQGMLFEFPKPQKIGMWMANTPLALDMIFIDGSGKITEIISGTVPFSTDPIRSTYRNKAVLEMHAGSADRLGIQENDTVRHPIFDLKN